MHSQPQSPLLRLPAELRFEIYKYSLLARYPIIEPLYKKDRGMATNLRFLPRLGAGLAATCRRVNAELDLEPLYRDNTFVLMDIRQAATFFGSVKREFREMITSVTIDLLHCIGFDGETDPFSEMEWFPYLACPTTHQGMRDSEYYHRPSNFDNDGGHCSPITCSHLLFDLPNVQHITLDVRNAQREACCPSEVRRMLAAFLRGSCAGESNEISTLRTCRPDLAITILPAGAQRVVGCWSCSRNAGNEPWAPKWLCAGQKAGGCWRTYEAVENR